MLSGNGNRGTHVQRKCLMIDGKLFSFLFVSAARSELMWRELNGRQYLVNFLFCRRWSQLKLKHVWFPSGQYASYWNAFLLQTYFENDLNLV